MSQVKAKEKSFLDEVVLSLTGLVREALIFTFVAIALFVLIALLSFDAHDPGWSHTASDADIKNAGGAVGAWVSDCVYTLFGLAAFGVPVWLAFLGYRIVRARTLVPAHPWILALRWAGALASLLAAAGMAEAYWYSLGTELPEGSGGVVGQEVWGGLAGAFGEVGSRIALTVIILGGISLSTHVSWLALLDQIGKIAIAGVNGLLRLVAGTLTKQVSVTTGVSDDIASPDLAGPIVSPPAKKRAKSTKRLEPQLDTAPERAPSIQTYEPITPAGYTAPAGGNLPPLDLLNDSAPKVRAYTPEALEQMSAQVEAILRDFGVDVKVDAVHPGPVITRFELELAPGVKVSRVSGLAKDLARALLVSSVRIVEIIPGKSVIGLEIPNRERELVLLRSVLMSDEYQGTESALTLVLGKDISGRPVAANLAKMPHLLVAGTTGSGKSVAVNVMILSLLYKAKADEVRMIMIDPKMLELSVYEGIPHLLTPVVTDMKEAANALRWCVAEMERRYKLMSMLGVRNLAGYNEKVKDAIAAGSPILDPMFRPELHLDVEVAPTLAPLPFIVIVIDELADMMMIVGKKVEELIARLAQKARAAGLHLILATQRPSVDVITGLIKANIPTRIAFQVSSKIDSRTIIDQGGAEALLGNGDMLYLAPGTGLPVRVHGAFVGDGEVHAVVDFLKRMGPVKYLLDITRFSEDSGDASGGSYRGGGSDDGEEPMDQYYDEAVRFVTESRKASTSSLQRRFKVGYNRAARMIEEMERAGIISPADATGGRTVIAPPPPEL